MEKQSLRHVQLQKRKQKKKFQSELILRYKNALLKTNNRRRSAKLKRFRNNLPLRSAILKLIIVLIPYIYKMFSKTHGSTQTTC